MKFEQLIERLALLINELENKAQSLDQQNAKGRNQSQFKHRPIFSDTLFKTRSDKYLNYVEEVKSKLAQLNELLARNHNEFAEELITQIERQISSLFTAIQSNHARRKKLVAKRKPQTSNQYKQAAQHVLMPTHALYNKLSEHHEFERRLATMIAEREYQRADANGKLSEKLSAEILALHQRLGRCRQAISGIEREIELAEKRGAKAR